MPHKVQTRYFPHHAKVYETTSKIQGACATYFILELSINVLLKQKVM